ncbi:MAG: serpin family protein, partial [Tepidisphaerales bacterium]
ALAMVAEGARYETAEEMGRVMRYPDSIRSAGVEAASRPWNLAPIHAGLAALNERLNGQPDEKPARKRIQELRDQLDDINRQIERALYDPVRDRAHALGAKATDITIELSSLLPQVDRYELRVANAVWGERTCPIEKSYIDVIAGYCKTGGIFPLDFQNDYGPSIDRINAWVAEQTNQRIRNLIPKDALSQNQRGLLSLVLTNAIYFRGEWAEVFPATETKPDNFLLAKGGKDKVLMMHHGEVRARYAAFNADGAFFNTPDEIQRNKGNRGGTPAFAYPAADGFAVLELPYKGAGLAMAIILPRSPDGLPAIEKKLTPTSLDSWLRRLQQRTVDVYIPRFRLETAYGMGHTLQAMGMVRAFTNPIEPAGAQFDGMSASQDPRLKLCISQVLHKAFVEVNEKGTEAAAATATEMLLGALLPDTVPFTPTFRADKPFLFLIRDVKSGTILFVGRMNNPPQ